MDEKSEVLMHFEIPYDGKKAVRGLFWINIGAYILFLAYIGILLATHKIEFNDEVKIGIAVGISIFTAIYLLIRYASVKYDKINARREMYVYSDKLVYKQGDYTFETPYILTKRLEININDKGAFIRGNYGQKINGFEMWSYKSYRTNMPKDASYKEYVEKTFIPFVNLLIKEIKKKNPDLQVLWNDTRKKYK